MPVFILPRWHKHLKPIERGIRDWSIVSEHCFQLIARCYQLGFAAPNHSTTQYSRRSLTQCTCLNVLSERTYNAIGDFYVDGHG